jgi:general secretion pathway protein D
MRQTYVRTRLTILLLLVATLLMAASPSAKDLFNRGRRAEKAGRLTEAFLLYSQAAAIAPGKGEYWARAQAVRARSEEASPGSIAAAQVPAPALPAPTPPAPAFAPPTPEDIIAARQPLPPTELKAEPGKKDFDLRGDSRQLFQAMAKAWGLECDFDTDYQPVRPFHFELSGVDYRQALHGMELATGSFIVPLSEKRFLVVKDTPAKRAEREPVVEVGIELPTTSPQDFAAMVAAVSQSMAIERVQWDTQKNMVFLKDRISKVLPARDMFQNLMRPPGEVGVDLEFLEVSRNDAITYGLNLQSQVPLIPLTTWRNNKPSIASGIASLISFGGGTTLIGLGVMNAALVAKMSDSSGDVLLRSFVRSTDGKAATVHVGDRYPIMTSGYFGPQSYSEGGQVYTPPPSFNYEDLGFNLKLTPTLHDEEEITMDVEAEFKVLSGAAVDGIPVISHRLVKSRARMRIGEWAVIGGLLNSQEARSVAGIAGLAGIPGLGPLFSTRDRTNSGREVLILMRPRLLRPPASASPSYSFHLGSETKPITPL